jgi:hypothetical protein
MVRRSSKRPGDSGVIRQEDVLAEVQLDRTTRERLKVLESDFIYITPPPSETGTCSSPAARSSSGPPS